MGVPNSKTQSFEANLLQQILAHEISNLKEPNVFPAVAHLIKERQATAKEIAALAPFMSQPCHTAKISNVAKLFRGIQIHSGDAIVYSNGDSSSTWSVARVLFHAHVFDMAATLVQLWTIDALEKHHATCHLGDSIGLIPMGNILYPVPYNKSNSKAIVLLPYQLYCQARKISFAAHMHQYSFKETQALRLPIFFWKHRAFLASHVLQTCLYFHGKMVLQSLFPLKEIISTKCENESRGKPQKKLYIASN